MINLLAVISTRKAQCNQTAGVGTTPLVVSSKARCSFSKCKHLHLNATLQGPSILRTGRKTMPEFLFSLNEGSEYSQYYQLMDTDDMSF